MTASPTFRSSCRYLAVALLLFGLAGCSGLAGVNRDTFRPYVPEVVQGNFISKEQRQVLRLGMARVQVREVLGTPLVASLFHGDRWDYAFSIQRQGVAPQNFRLTVHFKDDLLDRIEGDDLPSESEFAERIAVPEDRKVVPRLEATSKELEKFQKSAPAPVNATLKPAAPPPDKIYPPLEAP